MVEPTTSTELSRTESERLLAQKPAAETRSTASITVRVRRAESSRGAQVDEPSRGAQADEPSRGAPADVPTARAQAVRSEHPGAEARTAHESGRFGTRALVNPRFETLRSLEPRVPESRTRTRAFENPVVLGDDAEPTVPTSDPDSWD